MSRISHTGSPEESRFLLSRFYPFLEFSSRFLPLSKLLSRFISPASCESLTIIKELVGLVG